MKLALCITFIFFAKITFGYQAEDLCLDLAESEGIEFTTLYQCIGEPEDTRTLFPKLNAPKDPYLCSFIINDKYEFIDHDGSEFEESIERIVFYDIANKFMSTEYQTSSGGGQFGALFQDTRTNRSATIVMSRQSTKSAQLTYTLFKNKMTRSKVLIERELECEIIR